MTDLGNEVEGVEVGQFLSLHIRNHFEDKILLSEKGVNKRCKE